MSQSPFISNIESDTLQNTNYRKVLYTGHLQLVLMSLKPGEEIGVEIHEGHDQFFRIEAGQAKVLLAGKEINVSAGDSFIVPDSVEHNVTNDGDVDLKVYTIYAPSQHPEGTVQATKQ